MANFGSGASAERRKAVTLIIEDYRNPYPLSFLADTGARRAPPFHTPTIRGGDTLRSENKSRATHTHGRRPQGVRLKVPVCLVCG
jgi:hypothetical protein